MTPTRSGRSRRHQSPSAPLARLPFADAAPSVAPAQWQATWIWCRQRTAGTHDYVYFRREVHLSSPPGQALLRLAAERDATLWIDGELIDHGPPVSDPRFKRYATYDLTHRLSVGRHCLAVRVYHDRGRGGLTAHADAHGLLCQLELDGVVAVATDATWRALHSQAYLPPGIAFGDILWPEVFDARRDTPGWQLAGFDDSAWPMAAPEIPPSHSLWAAEQPGARFFPWVNLLPCETRPLSRVLLRPARLLLVGEVRQQREASAHDTSVRMSLETPGRLAKASVLDAEGLLDGSRPARIRNSSLTEPDATFDGLRNATLVLDFGRLINARFGFRLTADAAVIDIGYAYRLDEGRVIPYTSDRAALADQYIARPGDQHWETADWRHFRYVQVTFRDLPDELHLHAVWADELCPFGPPRGHFDCSDPVLTRAFAVVQRGAALAAPLIPGKYRYTRDTAARSAVRQQLYDLLTAPLQNGPVE